MKFLTRKVKVLGKSVPVFALVLILMTGIATAALLTYYGKITGSATVTQSVTLNGQSYPAEQKFSFDTMNFVAGKTITDCDTDGSGYSLKNNADVEAPVQFGTTCGNSVGSDDGTKAATYIDWAGKCKGIDTEIYGILKLSTKNTATWALDGIKATVKYTIVGNSFQAEVIDGVIPEYELIYYKDKVDAFTIGDREANPQKAIKIAGVSGDLPYADDGNSKLGADYCAALDNYEHCRGAKIWYVPSGALSNCVDNVCDIAWGQWGNFLYETDLIVYSNDADNKITLPAKGGFNFCEKNDFALNLVPDTYTLTTSIVPVTA